ncbi:MAG: HAD family hydrolase [Candidatus Eremiobacteraeota bacterium]|nr:HAD family hydrolase [Candidatus Eremiobacteraeota bacterium]
MALRATAVIFDFDHTLGVDNKLEEEVLAGLARAYCGADPGSEAVKKALERYRYEPVPLDVVIADGLLSWGCPASVVADAAHDFRQRCLALAPLRVRPMPGAQQMLDALDACGMPMGILSNGWTELQHLKAQLIGFPGPVLASEEIDEWKPDIQAFRIALTRFHMDAMRTAYVGDNPLVDIAGAKAAGMQAVWADLEGHPYPQDITEPDATIRHLSELPQELAGAAP